MRTIQLSALAVALFSTAATAAIDSRSFAMGGTGVSNANYLTSSFHNPALAARYSERDDFGMILPTVNVRAHDSGDLMTGIDTFIDAFDIWEDSNGADEEALKEWQNALSSMDGEVVNADVSTGMVIAIPNRYLSANMFAMVNVTAFARPDVEDSDLTITDPDDEMESRVLGLGAGTIDIGLTLARELDVDALPGRLYLGVSPKFQQLVALGYSAAIEDSDDDDFDFDDANTSSGFNLDIGLAYDVNDNIQLGFSARNLIEHSLETNTYSTAHSDLTKATYVVGPEYVIGASYQTRFISVSADVDLNEKEYFKDIDYATQYARLGAELDAWSWAQIRAGYSMSMNDYSEDMVTAGLGLKLFGSAGLDLSAGYGSDNNYGVAAQFILQI
jgi:opacity protein-like surface antigen